MHVPNALERNFLHLLQGIYCFDKNFFYNVHKKRLLLDIYE